MAFRNIQAGMATYRGHGGDRGDAYYAHPTNAGPHPGVVVIHHMPGWDEWTCEVARCKLSHLIQGAVDCWGGNVVVDDKSRLTKAQPVAPHDLTEGINCPVLGLFGNEDPNPTADQVNRNEAELKRLGKNYEFHRYDGAGHAFFAHYRPNYRPEQAVDGWHKVFGFFHKNLGAPAR